MRLRLLFSESIRSLGANLSTTIAATMTVLIGMFLLGLFIALGSWVVSWSDHVKDQLQVKVFFVESVKPKQINAVGGYLGTLETEHSGVGANEAHDGEGVGALVFPAVLNLGNGHVEGDLPGYQIREAGMVAMR